MSDIRLHWGSFEDVAPTLEPEKFRLIYTDPPYPREMAGPCFWALAKHSARLLADGGSLMTIAPHYFLDEAMEIMRGSGLKWRWIYAMDQEAGHHPRMAMGIEVRWKPILHYVKRAFPQGRGFVRDMVTIPGPEKGLDPWQQAEAWATYYIERMTDPGDWVLDPFMGAGTVPAVCKRLGRHCVGLDRKAEMVAIARQRVDGIP